MDEEQIDKVHKGRLASIIKTDVKTYITQEQDKIIDRLVTDFRDNTLTTERIWGSIGALAGLRNLLSTLETDIKRGMKASENG